jgi:aspartyl-tRNA(Asn)/glutamyl-tRNA(Gln) amidotransferase subunit C
VGVTVRDVEHVAALACLAVDANQVRELVVELNSILQHMETLARVDTEGLPEVSGVGASGSPLRPDEGPPLPLGGARDDCAPRTREGFFLVPRLSTHEGRDATS